MIIIVALVFIFVLSQRRKSITVVINGHQMKFITYKSTIKEALENERILIGAEDKLKPSLNSKLTNNEIIILKRAVKLNLAFDGKSLNIKSAEKNIDLLLKRRRITLGKEDRVSPSKNTQLYENMKIKITRVKTKIVSQLIPIGFKNITSTNRSIPNTQKRLLHEGKNGQLKIIYSIIYEDGKAVSTKVIKEIVVKKPVDRLIVLGGYPHMPVSRGGDILPFTEKYRVRATAYWAVNGIGKTYTGSGRKAKRDIDGYSTIAVDRHLIPYGTKVFIEGYGFAIAADTGSAIVGKTIDVFFDTKNEALNWAVKHPYLYILE